MRYATAVLVACNSNPLDQGKPVQSNTEAAPASGLSPEAKKSSAPVVDLTGKKLVTHEVTVDRITFTIDIPEGLPRDKSGDWDDPSPQYERAPKVFLQTIEKTRVSSMDKAKYHATLDARSKPWVRQEERDDGYGVTTIAENKSTIEAVTYRAANADTYIRCKTIQSAGDEPLPKLEQTRKLLEGICDSVKLK